MKKSTKILLIIIILIILTGIWYFYNSRKKENINKTGQNTTKTQTSTPTPNSTQTPTPTPTKQESKYVLPIDEFEKRITKKTFGQFITAENSPIENERFSGYHTGVDVEYEDISEKVPIYAISDGKVIYSGFVNGYGGFIAIEHNDFISIYGHLNPESLVKNNTEIKKGEQIGILGEGNTQETDFERKHLHFGILNGNSLDFRGYVQNESELSIWQNPIDFLK